MFFKFLSGQEPSNGENSRIIEGLEMDIVSHDVKKFFGLLLKKNGYGLEQFYSPLVVHTTPEQEELKAICAYKGFIVTNTNPTFTTVTAFGVAFLADANSPPHEAT